MCLATSGRGSECKGETHENDILIDSELARFEAAITVIDGSGFMLNSEEMMR